MVKAIMTDGYKSINMPLDFDSDIGWEQIGGKAIETKDAELYSKVSAVFRAAQINADAIASIPFAVFDKSDNEIDNSSNWKNAVGFMQSPKKLLRLWRLSLFMTNAAYGYIDATKAAGKRSDNLRYISPSTISIDADAGGISAFIRRVGGVETRWREDDPRLFYIHRLDWDAELLPAKNTEFSACSNAAGIMYAADIYIRKFFERQGILPTMLLVKGVPQRAERENLEKFFDRLMRGLTRTVGKVLNAEMIDVKQIGVGVDSLKDNAQYRQSIENVAMASGIPLSLLLSNSANYATAETEHESWYRDNVMPYAEFFAEALNNRLFEPRGLRFEFLTEMNTVAQGEEERRAAATRVYYEILRDGGYPTPLQLAMQITGVDLPSGVDVETLDAAKKEEDKDEAAEDDTDTDTDNEVIEEAVIENVAPRKSFLTFAEFEELKVWRDKCYRAVKNGKALPLDFDCRVVGEAISSTVRAALESAKSEDDITVIFDDVANADVSEARLLAAAINKLAEAAGEKNDKASNLSERPTDAAGGETKAAEEAKADGDEAK